MNRRSKIIAVSLCAAQIVAMIPVTASAANSGVSVDTIAAGENHSLVIKSDMSLWAAGDNSKGQLGIGSGESESNGKKVMDKVVYAEANDDVSFAIDQNGTLYGWGDNSNGQIDPGTSSTYIYTPQKLMDNVAEVAAGDTHTVALLRDGSVMGWGSNEYGELGFASNSRKNDDVNIAQNAVDIAAGDGFTIVVTEKGEVYACGNNESGQLGNGSYRDSDSLVKVIDSGAASADAGDEHSLVLMNDGTVRAAGNNTHGQLGLDDDSSTFNSFEKVSIRNVSSVFAGGSSSGAVLDSGVLYTWGDNTYSQLHNGKTEDLYVPTTVTSGVVSIAFGEHHSVMLKNNGRVSTAGSGLYGELFSTAAGTNVAKPALVSRKIVAYSAGADHAAAIDDMGVLYTWGNNDKGQLGTGDTTSRKKPTKVKLDVDAIGVWCGDKVTIVQTSDNNVYTFGDNSSCMLGFKSRSAILKAPTINEYLSGDVIDKIVFSDGFALALIRGAVWGWGKNVSSRLCALPKTVEYAQQVDDVISGGIIDIAAGSNHCFAVTSGGELYGWGSNSSNVLGTSTDSRIVDTPTLLEITDVKKNVLSFSRIASSGNHTLAVTSDGVVYGWGENGSGELGSDSSRLRNPSKVSSSGDGVFTSGNFSAVLDSGDLYMSGSNSSGQQGNGSTKSVYSFSKLLKSGVTSVSLGDDFAGFITDNNELYCWGNNSNGQVGNGQGGTNTDPQTVINDGLCQKVVQATSVTLDKTTLSLKPNATARLTATVNPSDASSKTVTWTSSNTAVATVNDSGLVKAVKVGSATITAKTANGLTAQCVVTVATSVSSFSVSPAKSKTINVDGSFTFKAKIYPANADDKTLLYTSSNEDVAVVDDNGTVTGVSAGKAVITITAKSNPAKTRKVTVIVRPDKVKITYRKSTADGIILEWDQSDYADGYVIYRRNSAKGKGKVIGEVESYDPDEMTFTDSTGVKGKIYYYYIKSYVTVDGKRIYSSASRIYKIKAK